MSSPYVPAGAAADLPPPIPVGAASAGAAPPHASSVYGHAPDLDDRQMQCLRSQGFPTGLARAVGRLPSEFPLRVWVVDNSGSMIADDGRRLVETARRTDVRTVRCTRWAELQECVVYHARMAALLCAPTSFRLLNHPGAGVGPQEFGVAEGRRGGDGGGVDPAGADRDAMEVERIVVRASPRGVTPLTEHVLAIHDRVEAMAPRLRSEGQRVVVVLATDGLPSDDQGHGGRFISDQFVQALRLLGSLPVWIVIRLCTDVEEVVRFYNEIDRNMELNLEVLDDFLDESKEIYKHNPWLNYALPLHRCREMGFDDKTLDLLDERPLTRSEVSRFCALLFGDERWDDMPDPDVDWDGFLRKVRILAQEEGGQWNPIRKKTMPWIDPKRLDAIYGERKGNIVILLAGAILFLVVIYFFLKHQD